MKSALQTILRAYNEAFISIVPYVILMATTILLSNLLPILNIDSLLITKESLQLARTVLHDFFYFVLMIAVAFQLAKSYAISETIVIFQSIAIFITTEVLVNSHNALETLLSSSSLFLVIIIPLVAVKSIDYFTPVRTTYQDIGTELNTSFTHIYSGIITFVLVTGLMVLLTELFKLTLGSEALKFNLSNEVLFIFRTLVNHLLWFIGLHGSHVYNAIFGVDILSEQALPGLNFRHFYEIFVVYGGAGATLSLIIAVFISTEDPHSKRIAKLAFPFAIFNINEVLLYGLPIIFNRRLIIPFLLTPLVNSVLAYAFLSAFTIEMATVEIPWVTPTFIDSYIITQGNLSALALQFFLITLGVVIYIPFVRSYTLEQAGNYQKERLGQRLNLPVRLRSSRVSKVKKERQSIILNNEEIDRYIRLLEKATLLVYYQPKVNIQKKTCHRFEALLRICPNDDKVKGPFFLPTLEKAGLAPIIDLWACQQVGDHLRDWKTQPIPEISINLHTDTLARSDVIEEIISIHKGNPVGFEIVERDFLNNAIALENIKQLKTHGFKILIDDFGTGMSSMENLCHVPVDILKIDKSLADLILTENGYIVCRNIVNLCKDMNFGCIIEGIEDEKQLEAALRLGIPLVQGFYFSPAITKAEAEIFKPEVRASNKGLPDEA